MIALWLLACSGDGETEPPTYDGGWQTAATLLSPLQEHAVVVRDGQVVVIGGGVAVTVAGRIYLPGGGDTQSLGVVDTHDVYVPE